MTPRSSPTTWRSSPRPSNMRAAGAPHDQDLHAWHPRLMQRVELAAESRRRVPRRARLDRRTRSAGRGLCSPACPNVPALMDDLVVFTNALDVRRGHASRRRARTVRDDPSLRRRQRPHRPARSCSGSLARRLDVAVPPPTSVLIARDPGGYLSGLHWFRTGEHARWVAWFADVVERLGNRGLEWARRGRRADARRGALAADLRADCGRASHRRDPARASGDHRRDRGPVCRRVSDTAARGASSNCTSEASSSRTPCPGGHRPSANLVARATARRPRAHLNTSGSARERLAVAPDRDARPDQLHNAERPRPGQEPVDTRQDAPRREPEHVPAALGSSSVYITIMNVSAQTP